MIRLEPNPRNRALLTLLYGAGLRIAEVCGLRWRDLAERDGAGQVTVYGKGGKTRVVLLSASTWATLGEIGGSTDPDAPVFRSRKGGPLDASQVHRIVKAAAERAGLSGEVSAHWLRHAHAKPQPRPRGAHPPRAADARARLGGHHGPLPARSTHRWPGPVPRGVSHRRGAVSEASGFEKQSKDFKARTLAWRLK